MQLLSGVARAAKRTPVSTCLLVLMCLILLLSFSNDDACIHIRFTKLLPWQFITYPFAMTTMQPWRIALGIATIVLGASAESAVGSSEYATFVIFTTLATGITVLLIEFLVVVPLLCVGRLITGGTIDLHGYTGVWPVAEAAAFCLCRVRGLSALVGPPLYGVQLTLQQLPLAIVWLALICDVISFVTGHTLEDYDQLCEGSRVMVATIALLLSWLFARRLTSAFSTPPLEVFMYPSAMKSGVRWICERLQASPLRVLLLPRDEVNGAAAAMPMPLFSRTVGSNVLARNHITPTATTPTALLPGTTPEEAERYRLIAREALAHRLGQQTSLPAVTFADATESEAKTE